MRKQTDVSLRLLALRAARTDERPPALRLLPPGCCQLNCVVPEEAVVQDAVDVDGAEGVLHGPQGTVARAVAAGVPVAAGAGLLHHAVGGRVDEVHAVRKRDLWPSKIV